MEVEATDLENAVLDAHDLAAGIALCAKVMELIERGEECRAGVRVAFAADVQTTGM
jgi:hypothetical protein